MHRVRDRGNGVGGRLPRGVTSITSVGQVERGTGRVKESSLTLPTPLEFVLTLMVHPPLLARPKQTRAGIQKNGHSSHQRSAVARCDVSCQGFGVRALESDRTNLEPWFWSSLTA